MVRRDWKRLVWGLACGAGIVLMLAGAAQAVDCVGLSAFANPSSAQLLRLNVKLTDPRRFQLRLTPSVVLRGRGCAVAIGAAVACENGGGYKNDAFDIVVCPVDTAQLRSVLGSLQNVPGLQDAQCSRPGCLAISVVDPDETAPRAYACEVDSAVARSVLRGLRGAVAGSDSALEALDLLACQTQLVDAWATEDATARTAVSIEMVPQPGRDGRLVGTVKVRNASAAAMAGPVVVVPVFELPIEVANADGIVPCNGPCAGAPFFILNGGSGLAPGATANVRVRFRDAGQRPVRLVRAFVLNGVHVH